MATPAKINLDAAIGYEGEDEDRDFVEVELFGEDFRVLLGINVFASIGVLDGDSASMTKMLLNMIHGQDRARFNSRMQSTSFLVGEGATDRLIALFNGIAEVASGERPIKRSAVSSASSRKRVAGRNSGARALAAASK